MSFFKRGNISRLDCQEHEKMMITKRAQLLDELKLGIWDKDEFCAKVTEMERKHAGDGSPPVKQQKT